MNEEIEQRVRSYFADIEQEAPVTRSAPIRAVLRARRPRPAVRYRLAAVALSAVVTAVVVQARTGPANHSSVGTTETAPTTADAAVPPSSALTPETFPAADLRVQNYLVVGADNGACPSPSIDDAGGIGDRTGLGERSDTIMMARIDPASGQVAILSFPRDLWVKIGGTNTSSRINSAFTHNDPQVLINTIYENFGIAVDHYIQVDFCGFEHIVDAIGGVVVPFAQPVRDLNTGFAVAAAGCSRLDGAQALAYVRSRHLQYLDETGEWREDPTSDLGRIDRQQDFVWRTLLSATAHGLSDPGSAATLVQTVLKNVVTDAYFTPDTALQLAGVLRDVQPAAIMHEHIAVTPTVIAGAAVLLPDMTDASSQAALAIFRGTHAALIPPSTTPSAAQVSTDSTAIVPPATATC